MTRVILIRHGEPSATARGRCYGKLDVELSPLGHEQAARVADSLARESIAAIYASPRRRALGTAQPLATARGLTITVENALRELDFGAFEGMSYQEAERAHPEIYRAWMERPTEVDFPGGESWTILRARVLAAFARIVERHRERTLAIVSHGGPLRAILAQALGMPSENIFRLAQGYGGVSVLQMFGVEAVVECVNR